MLMNEENLKMYENLLENCDTTEKLVNILESFNANWKEHIYENSFNLYYERIQLYDKVADVIIKLGAYPESIHSFLKENLGASQVKKIGDVVKINEELIADYVDYYINKKDVASCVTIANLKGVDLKKIEEFVLRSTNETELLRMAQTVEGADIGRIMARLSRLVCVAKDETLRKKRNRAFIIVSDMYAKQRNNDETTK